MILLHDSDPFSTTPEAARQLIRELRDRGYRFGYSPAGPGRWCLPGSGRS
ncbi:MAG: hypothetical protein V8Q30_01210 [Acutalibacteraceae bacterium]